MKEATRLKVIIFGATGKTGELVVQQAINAGFEITAFVRNPLKLKTSHPLLHVYEGDALDISAVSKAIEGHDAVISCLGSNTGLRKSTVLGEMGTIIAQAMKEKNVSRIIYLASAGIDKEIPGVSGKLIMKLLGKVLVDHRTAVDAIQANQLEWTIARPMSLNDGPLIGSYREDFNSVPKNGRAISRADVAHFLLRSLEDKKYINQSVAICY